MEPLWLVNKNPHPTTKQPQKNAATAKCNLILKQTCDRIKTLFVTQNKLSQFTKLLDQDRGAGKIGLLKNALRKLQSSAPTIDFYKHKHEECVNFDNGRCRAAHFTNLDPKGTACPHFKPKQKAENDKT